jgi:hypothetical protein
MKRTYAYSLVSIANTQSELIYQPSGRSLSISFTAFLFQADCGMTAT